jgi:arabinose operon protein AraL
MLMRRPVDGFVFDLDGTVYLGDRALPGAVEGIKELRRGGKRILFVSNKPLQPREVYAQKLTGIGIPTPVEDVITSAFVLGSYLAKQQPDLRFYVVGETPLGEELRRYGLNVVDDLPNQDQKQVMDPEGIDAVIVAFDRTLSYRKLNMAYQALCRGARFFATNADKVCPLPGGGIPDAGATIAALEHITGRQVELVAGKPSALITEVALDLLDLPPERCMMVGDRLETDILMGQKAGMMTTLVLTGITSLEDVSRSALAPTFVADKLSDLVGLVI